MPSMNVAKQFKFTFPDGRQEVFLPGHYDNVPSEVTDSFFAKAHMVGAQPTLPRVGTPEYAALARQKAAALIEEARLKQEEADRAAEEMRQAEEAARRAVQAGILGTERPAEPGALRQEAGERVNPVTNHVADPATLSMPVQRMPDAPLTPQRSLPAMESYKFQSEKDAEEAQAEEARRQSMRTHLENSEAQAERAATPPTNMPNDASHAPAGALPGDGGDGSSAEGANGASARPKPVL